ncbi:MAG: thrombospondin type 3 repeat-containing protein [Candidatus Yonathbacteria bacterium]|nr:thrombospondin type 3 repeat-containing protein [Candidatus Yonathbacteria bacterium]
MKKFLFLFLIFGIAPFSYATPLPIKNAGFVPANIWYSKDPFFANEKIRIYTIIFNGSTYDLEGTVEFLDNGTLVGRTSFSLSGGGRVRDVWIDWKATEGRHAMTARITETMASTAGGTKRSIILDNTETGKSERDVDLDTDGDGVGNKEDLDDDNDGVPDVEELRNGTDPIKKDTDGDGLSDGKELEIVLKQKADAEKLIASSTITLGTILGTIKKVEENIPTPVKEGATLGANAIERFRVGEGYQVRLAKGEKAREIEAMKLRPAIVAQKDTSVLGTVSNTAEKPFAYVMLGILTALQYLLEWKIVFYGVLLYAIYRLIRWVSRKIRNRG